MLPKFVSRGSVVGEAEIVAFEARCGFPLPADYRQFLLDQNGGGRVATRITDEDDEYDDDEYDDDGNRTGIVQFFSLGSAALLTRPLDEVAQDPEGDLEEFDRLANDLDWVMTHCRDAGTRSYPPELLPVAEVFLGVLLLRLKGRGTGAVIHCYDPDGYEPGHVNKVAKSFAELLRDFDDYELA